MIPTMAGAEMVASYPMGPIMDGAGLNITVMSYRNSIDFGFLACTDLVPDVWELADAVTHAFEEIKDLFDPAGLMNPGKIVRATKMDDASLFRFRPDHRTLPLATADTARVVAAIEDMVRAAPAQYLWIHRRFKRQPGSAEKGELYR